MRFTHKLMKNTHYRSCSYNYLIRTIQRTTTYFSNQGLHMKLQPLLALGLTLLAASSQALAGATLDRIEQKKNWSAC